MDIVRIGKTMLPAVVVLVAGLFGINFVYNNYLADGAASVITLEPAAGEETTPVSVEDGATVATDTVVTTTETVTETVTETTDECAAAHAAAAEAIGTDAEADTAAAAKNCVDAANVKTAADIVIEDSNEAAVDAAEEATEHLPVTEGDDAVEAPAEEAAE